MKKLLLLVVSLLLGGSSGWSQTSIELNMNHLLGDTPFELGVGTENNIGHQFKVIRLQYYISEISITHDGGIETAIEDVWLLVNAGKILQADLGAHEINTIEKISFHIGVDPDHNHLDPAAYEVTHPLAPKFPSMHWGWASGYRFVAYEGEGGSALNQLYELHGLGDSNYFQVELDLDLSAVNDQIKIYIDADYARGLENIEVNSGVFVHGENLEAKQCLENFRDFVFSPAVQTTSITDLTGLRQFELHPNPANGSTTITLEADEAADYTIAVTDVSGKQLDYFDHLGTSSTIELTIDQPGFYLVSLMKAGQPVITKKLIAK